MAIAFQDKFEVGPIRRDLTMRSVALGIVMVVFVNVGAPYAKYILHSSLMACDYLPFGVMLPFIVAVVGLNPLMKVFSPKIAFTPCELAVAFIMGLVGSTLPTFGITGYLISTIASPYYYANTENGWGDYIQPHLPGWLLPSNDTKAMTWFYEGTRIEKQAVDCAGKQPAVFCEGLL